MNKGKLYTLHKHIIPTIYINNIIQTKQVVFRRERKKKQKTTYIPVMTVNEKMRSWI